MGAAAIRLMVAWSTFSRHEAGGLIGLLRTKGHVPVEHDLDALPSTRRPRRLLTAALR